MALAPGTHLGPYQVTGSLGAGGMGEVYRAKDTRLDRTVAIKVLPAEVSADPERRARFEREAKTIAGLNHPNICALFDVGEAAPSGVGGLPADLTLAPSRQPLAPVRYLVMEHLQGETLAQRLEKGPLPLAQALTVAAEIADALSAAHRQGVIHRDLKPGNVMLTKTGAKLLDFGLAKLKGHGEQAAAASLASAPTERTPLTAEGLIVGTLQYMAPEQVEGKLADARTDLWALGAILYEMLTGKRAFEGTSAASLIGHIMQAEPPALATLQPLTPPAVDRLVRRCLRKDPDERWDTAHDVAGELRWLREADDAATPAQPAHRRLLPRALVPVTMLTMVAIGAALIWVLRPAAPLVARPSLDVRPADEVNSGSSSTSGRPSQTPGGSRTAFTWTPDGQALVFVGRQAGAQRLYVRPLGAAEARPIANTEGAQAPAVSPDGQWVAFWANGKIWKVRIDGSPPTDLAPNGGPLPHPLGLAWSTRGDVFFGKLNLIWHIPVNGEPGPVTKLLRGDWNHSLPWVLPGGRTILYTARKRIYSWGGDEIVAQTLDTGTRKTVLKDAADARYVASGHLVFLRQGRLFAVAFDPERLEVTGDEVPVLETVAQALTDSSSRDVIGAGQYAVSSTGHLAWVSSAPPSWPLRSLVTVNQQGHVTALRAEARPYAAAVRLSPDERWLAVGINELYERGLWVYDLARPNLTPRALNRGDEASWPAWSRDSREIAFSLLKDARFSLVTKPVDSDVSAPPAVIAEGVFCPSSFVPDGILGLEGVDGIVMVTREGKVQPKIRTEKNQEKWPDLSRDGRWLAYGSDASGRMEVYVTPYPDTRPADAQRASVDGGESPAWHPNARQLFYLSLEDATGQRRMMAADFSPGPPPRIGAAHELFRFDPEKLRFWAEPLRNYQVSRAGLFYVTEAHDAPEQPVTHIDLIPDWFKVLKVKAPARK